MDALTLKIKNLSVSYENQTKIQALYNANLTLAPNETLGIIGESGSGKSTLALAIMGLLGKGAKREGVIEYGDTTLTDLSESAYDHYRWKHISIVYQNGLDVLNPP